MDSIFTKIIKGEIPCYKVDENDRFIAFLDINPKAEGHTLVIPKKQIDRIWDLDDELYHALWDYAKEIAAKIENAIACDRVGMWVEGLEVPHAHVHLVPLPSNGFYGLKKPEKTDDAYMQSVAQKISK